MLVMNETVNALEAMQLWLMELGNEGRSPRTVDAYEAEITATIASVAANVSKMPASLVLSELTRDRLVGAIAEFRVRPDPRYTRHPDRAAGERSPARVARRVAAVKVFFKWCYATGRLAADPAALLRSPSKTKRLPKALEADAARSIIDHALESRWPERDMLVIVLALTTGLRLEEIATVKLTDIVGKPPHSLNVIGKGNKERRLPLPPVTQEALTVYLKSRSARLVKMGLDARTLFISTRPRVTSMDAHGEPIRSVEATKAGIAYITDRLLRRAGARRRGSRVHVLRHTFATLGLRPDPVTGLPAYTLRQLQTALGHANLSTIQVYTEVSDAELVKAAAAHPLAQER